MNAGYTPPMQRALPWILTALAGLALALAMPGPGIWPLAFVFPVLLLEGLERSRSRWQPWLLGWLAGTVHWLVATSWVYDVMHHYGGLAAPAAVAVLLGMAAYLGIIWALIAGVVFLVPSVWRIWFLPVVWVGIDGLRRFQPYQFPWDDVAATVATEFPVELIADTLYPVNFAIPSAVVRDRETSMNCGMAHPTNPWAYVAVAGDDG